VFDSLGQTSSETKPPSDLDLSPAAVLASMAKDGDPVPTGFAPLDARLRRGGVPPGRVISVGGAPFVGKTTVVADIALHVSQKMPVYALFSDEGRTQAAMRMGVMMGIPLEQIEEDPAKCATRLEEALGERSITLRKPDCDLATAADLFDFAANRTGAGNPAMVILDSIQTIPARRELDAGSEREAYKLFMQLCRERASGNGWIVLLTSQSNRASYSRRKAEENSVAMASFSGTAAIEFLSDVALVMSLPNESDQIVKVEMVKNRLVNSQNRLPKSFNVRYDSASGRMLEVDESSLEAANAEATRIKLAPAMSAVMGELAKGQELSGSELERRLKGRGPGTGTTSVRMAVRLLESDEKITSVYREGKGGGYFYAVR